MHIETGQLDAIREKLYVHVMIKSSLGADGLTTVPAEVLEALSLRSGDLVRYEIEGDQVRVTRVDDDNAGFTDEELEPIIEEALAAFERDGTTYSAEEVFAELHERIEALSRRKDAA